VLAPLTARAVSDLLAARPVAPAIGALAPA
jgi:hypothetical protein